MGSVQEEVLDAALFVRLEVSRRGDELLAHVSRTRLRVVQRHQQAAVSDELLQDGKRHVPFERQGGDERHAQAVQWEERTDALVAG